VDSQIRDRAFIANVESRFSTGGVRNSAGDDELAVEEAVGGEGERINGGDARAGWSLGQLRGEAAELIVRAARVHRDGAVGKVADRAADPQTNGDER
jgi:hypothetical protein